MPNTLHAASHPRWLYASAWLATPEDSMRYGNCNFVEAPALVLDASLPPIPVRIDLATLTYARSRQLSYAWERYQHEDTGQYRVRITGINIDRSTGNPERAVTLGWLDFLARYTSDTHQFTFADETMAAGDEEEDKRSARRRR